jgi:hypothetical protein
MSLVSVAPAVPPLVTLPQTVRLHLCRPGGHSRAIRLGVPVHKQQHQRSRQRAAAAADAQPPGSTGGATAAAPAAAGCWRPCQQQRRAPRQPAAGHRRCAAQRRAIKLRCALSGRQSCLCCIACLRTRCSRLQGCIGLYRPDDVHGMLRTVLGSAARPNCACKPCKLVMPGVGQLGSFEGSGGGLSGLDDVSARVQQIQLIEQLSASGERWMLPAAPHCTPTQDCVC